VAGFTEVWHAPPLSAYELRALAFRRPSMPDQRRLLGIPLDLPGAGV
jgi:hypothetical protein